MSSHTRIGCVLLACSGLIGCKHSPEITAVSLNRSHCAHPLAFLYDPCGEPAGIPFYLPKPLLIISKNFRSIEEAKVGLTDPAPIPGYFDDQAKYADLNARTNFDTPDGSGGGKESGSETDRAQWSPDRKTHPYAEKGPHLTPQPGQLPDELVAPETFFTYQIVFVPDMSQKYGLRIKGGAGEIRAAMNLVNGWMFTGLGPYYMKDSSTAQNTLAAGIASNLAGQGVADVVKSLSQLRGLKPGTESENLTPDQLRGLVDTFEELRLQPQPITLHNFAEIYVYEPNLMPDGTMSWTMIANHNFNRDILGTVFRGYTGAGAAKPGPTESETLTPASTTVSGDGPVNVYVGAGATPASPPAQIPPPPPAGTPSIFEEAGAAGAQENEELTPLEVGADPLRNTLPPVPGQHPDPGNVQPRPGTPAIETPLGVGDLGVDAVRMDPNVARASAQFEGSHLPVLPPSQFINAASIVDPGPRARFEDYAQARRAAIADLRARGQRESTIQNPNPQNPPGRQEADTLQGQPESGLRAGNIVNQTFQFAPPAAPVVGHGHKRGGVKENSGGLLSFLHRRREQPKISTTIVDRDLGVTIPAGVNPFPSAPGGVGVDPFNAAAAAAAAATATGREQPGTALPDRIPLGAATPANPGSDGATQ